MEDLYSGPSFSSDDGDSGSVTGPISRPPKTGLTKAQFENRFGITDRNPYGQTGFAKFFDKFSKALGGKGVDYRQQFRDLDRFIIEIQVTVWHDLKNSNMTFIEIQKLPLMAELQVEA